MKYKEFLNMKNGYTLEILPEHAGDDKESGLIEVPEGAEYLLRHKDDGDELFFKEDFNFMSPTDQDGCWFLSKFDEYIGDKLDYMIKNYQSEVLWQRHTQPEELPFIDDKPKSIDETLVERQSSYGCYEDVAHITQEILKSLRAGRYEEMPATHKEAMHMIASKMARLVNGDFNHKDSWHDIGGYAKLVEGLL